MLLAALNGFFGKHENITAEELALQAQQGHEAASDQLLRSYSPFMKKTAAQVCKRFIDDHDDEYSIALSAFHEAIQGYEENKNASFLTFAHMIIRRRVIDFIRKENQRFEYSHDFHKGNDDTDGSDWIINSAAIKHYTAQEQAEMRKDEIRKYEMMLGDFGLSFAELVKVSPSHEDARVSSMQIAQLVAETNEYRDYLMAKKKLPIKEIEKLVGVSRKTIERNRKYIIAIALLIDSDLHYLKDYLKERLA